MRKLSLLFFSIFLISLNAKSAFAQEAAAENQEAKPKKIVVKKKKLKKVKKTAKEKKEEKAFKKKAKASKRYQKALWFAHVLRRKANQDKVLDLTVVQKKIPVFLVPQNGSFRPLVKLSFDYNREGWTLFDSQKNPIKISKEDQKPVIYAYLRSRISTVEISARGPGGPEEKEVIYLFAPEAREFKAVSMFDTVLFSMGHSHLVYRQNTSTAASYVNDSLLLGFQYFSPERGNKVGFYGDLYSTVYTYDSSPFRRSANFLEARLGLSFLSKVFKNPRIRSRILVGAQTTNLFVHEGDLGFKGLYGLNLGLRSEYFKSGKHSYLGEINITPYDTDLLGERSIELNLAWNRNLNNLRRLQVGFSYSNHIFSEGVANISADLSQLYFSISF